MRTRVRCVAEGCGWQGQRPLPSSCPCCDAELVAGPGHAGRKRPPAKGRRTRLAVDLDDATIAALKRRGPAARVARELIVAGLRRRA